MALPEFQLLRPKTIQSAVALLAQHKGDIQVLAGGTDLRLVAGAAGSRDAVARTNGHAPLAAARRSPFGIATAQSA